MGIRAIVPGVHSSKRNKQHKVYPYLLWDLVTDRPYQVWATDITYILMKKGFMYLTAVIDVYTRKVMNWSVSNSVEAERCKEMIEEAIAQHGKLEIINTDQGSHYTSNYFSNYIIDENIKLSMDGKGRAIDNAFIEGLWRSIKVEKIYLNPLKDGLDFYMLMTDYFHYYNNHRRHQFIDDQVPSEYYQNKLEKILNSL